MGSPECEFGRVWLIAGSAVFLSVSAFAGQLRKIEATLSQNLSGSIRSP